MPVTKKSLEPATSRLEKYTLFETATYYYLVGSDANDQHYKLLKLDRCAVQPRGLDDVLMEDTNIYVKSEISDMLSMISEGNKTSGGLVQVTTAFGLVGFVRFLDCYYFTLITQRKKVGCIGNNDIYAIKSVEVFAIKPKEKMQLSLKNVWNSMKEKINRTTVDTAESRYMGLFQFIDMSKDFFFSYTYDLTHSLQFNMNLVDKSFPPPPSEEIFEWSYHQAQEMRECLGDLSSAHWVLPIIHGSFQQRRFDMFGKIFDVALIARRSRHYAGTRYLKRGISVHGKVANDCEMEQIIELPEGVTSTFASFVQVRGSIPTYWYQETSVTMPKPPILVNRVDPTYLATQIHCADLFERYGAPLIVLDLVKQSEKRKRECIIGKEFRQAIEVVNMTIPDPKKIRYVGLDFSRMSKAAKHASSAVKNRRGSSVVVGAGDEWSNFQQSLGNEVLDKPVAAFNMESEKNVTVQHKDEQAPEARIDVLRELKIVSAWTLAETAFFCSSAKHIDSIKGHISAHSRAAAKENGCLQQSGVLRTNCIDCLDRTNVGQFAAGACFLNVGLTALGLMKSPVDEPSSGVLLGLMDLYSEMGDKIALQYGGSNAHKKVSGGGKGIAQAGKAGSKPNELLTSIKRYYSNAFTDRLKQDAMNLFLGYFIPSQSDSPLWDLENDYLLHNKLLRPQQPIFYQMLFDLDTFVRQHYGRGDFRDSLVGSRRKSKKSVAAVTAGADSSSNSLDLAISSNAGADVDYFDSDFVEKELEDIMHNFDQVIDSYLIKEESFMGRKKATPVKYLDAESIDHMTAAEQAAVRRLEKRKLVLKQKQVMLRVAYHMWWKEAIHKYHSKLQWMCLAPPETSFVIPYFDRAHETSVLTSFDEKFAEDFCNPFDATVAGPEDVFVQQSTLGDQSNITSTSIDIRRERVSVIHGGARRTQSVATTQSDTGDDFQFSISKFVLDIGKQATKAVVDGILGRNGDEEYLKQNEERENARKKLDQNKKKKKFRDQTPHWKNIDGDPNSKETLRTLIDLPISDDSLRVYDDCEAKYNSPEEFITAKNASHKKDFELLLKCVTVSENDVYGMENLARDSIVCDVIKDGMYLGMRRDASAMSAHEKIFTNLVFVEEEIVEYTTTKLLPTKAQKSTASIALSLAEPVQSFGHYAEVIRTSVISSPMLTDEELFSHLTTSGDAIKAARAAANYSKSLKSVGAAAMVSSLKNVEVEGIADVGVCPDGFAHQKQNQSEIALEKEVLDDDDSDSDEDELVRIEDVNQKVPFIDNDVLPPPISQASPGVAGGKQFVCVTSPVNEEVKFFKTFPRPVSGSPGEKERRSDLASSGVQILNNFLSTPLFEESNSLDAAINGEKSVVEMLDIPGPAKAVLSKIGAATNLAPGLEEEIYKLIANYMFQQTMYARNISYGRMSKRLSALTSQTDLLQYSSFYSLDELASNLDTIMFITSSESKGRFYELDHLRRALEGRHANYLKNVQDFQVAKGTMNAASVTAAIQQLKNKKAVLMKQSTALVEFLERLRNDSSDSSPSETFLTSKEWLICPDSAPEEYLSQFTQVQSDLYQKKDNEYVIANAVAMLSFYSFHNRNETEIGVWS